MENSFKIATFNAGLFEILSKDIVPYVDERINLICEELEKLNVDIICLQEIFSKKHFDLIKKHLHNFSYFNKAKAKNIFLSPGLCVFSKYPISNNHFTRFSTQQDIEKFSNHGFQTLTIILPNTNLEIVNVHLTSGGLTGNLETKRSSKVALKQAQQLLEIKNIQNKILIGDFNCGPRTDIDTYNFFLNENFQDIFTDFPLDENITWDNQNNLVSKQGFDMPTDRIDHIFTHKNSNFKLIKHEINLNKTFPNIPYNLSDHYGLQAEIIISNS